MKVYIGKSKAKGEVIAPPSKSYGHRLLIASYFSGGGEVFGLGTSNDIKATKACISALSSSNSPRILPCFESGSTLRFLIPLALLDGIESKFIGTKKLFSRGLSVYETIFKEQGISYTLEEDSLEVKGKLKPGLFRFDGDSSSQYITGLLFALPLLDGDSVIEINGKLESAPYVDMTLDVLSRYGVKVQREDDRFLIPGNQSYRANPQTVEGDESNAAFLYALNFLGGEVKVLGLNPDTLQGDKVYRDIFPLLASTHPTIDLSNAIDLGPICFALASLLNGATFTGIHRLRIKESDRVKEMAEICRLFGAKTKESDNEIEISPSLDKGPLGKIKIANDHRLVMASAIMMTTRGGTLQGAEAVNKSYPGFFEALRSLGVEVRIYD